MMGLGIGLGFFSIIGLLVLGILIFEVWMLVDAITNKHIDDTEKILWVIGMLLLHPFVALAYYFVVYSNRTRP